MSDREEMRLTAVGAMAAAGAALSINVVALDYANDRTHAAAVKLAVTMIEWDAARMSLEAARLRGKAGRAPGLGGGA